MHSNSETPAGGEARDEDEAPADSAEDEPPPPPRRRRRRLFDARAEGAVVRALVGGASVAAAAEAAGFSVSTVYAARARSAGFRAAVEAALAEGDGEVVIAPHKGRPLQLRRVRRRLFSVKLKDEFLEHFAATCSIAAAAEAIGVGRSTVNKHLAEDEDFQARFDRVLEVAHRQLRSELVRQRLEAAERAQAYGDKAAEAADFDRSLQLLREHKRGRGGDGEGGGGRGGGGVGDWGGGRRGRPPTVASNEEVREALIKALTAFGIRVRAKWAAEGKGPGSGGGAEGAGG
jgi:hypothetical protein